MNNCVIRWAKENAMDEIWTIACSGGADSIFLLYYLWFYFPENRHLLHVLHFNHKLRGNDSDEDEKFVCQFCERLNVPVSLGFLEIEREHSFDKTEAFLRFHRYNFFHEKLRSLNSSILFLGHQKNDILESFLMRLARGSGLQGLISPRPITRLNFHGRKIAHLRPILGFKKEEIVSFLRDKKIDWREDISNSKNDYFRNFIRNQVIPELQKGTDFDVFENAFQTRKFLEEENEAIDFFISSIVTNDFYELEKPDLSFLEKYPFAVARRIVYNWVKMQFKLLKLTEFSQKLPAVKFIDEIICFIFSKNREAKLFPFNDKISFCAENFTLRLIERQISSETKNEWSKIVLSQGTSLCFPNGCVLSFSIKQFDSFAKNELFSGKISSDFYGYFDYDKLKDQFDEFLVRQWQFGDFYHPLGMKNSRKKLHDCFIDKKISIEERKKIPVICKKGNSILWVPGFPPSEIFKVDDQTKFVLVFSFESKLL